MTDGDSTTQGSSAYGGITLGFIPPPASGGLDSMGCHWQLACQCIIGGTFPHADESTGGQAASGTLITRSVYKSPSVSSVLSVAGFRFLRNSIPNTCTSVPHTPANIVGMAPWARWMS